MSEIVNEAVIRVTADASGVEAGLRKVTEHTAGVEAGLQRVDETAKKTGRTLDNLGSGPGLRTVGEGAGTAAGQIDRATKNMGDAIQRATAAMSAGTKGSREYYESLANSRGINVAALRPYLDALDAATQKAALAADAQKKLDDSTKFLSDLKSRADGIGKTAAELMELRAAELGVADAARPMIQRMREAEEAAERGANKFGKFGDVAEKAKGILLALGAGAALGAFAAAVQASVDNLAELDDMAQKTGSSVESLSRLQKVATVFATDMSQVDDALTKLARGMTSVDDEGSKTERALRAIGLSAKDAGGNLRDPSELMVDIAKKLQGYSDGAGKAALVTDLLGKSGADLLPYLNDLAENYDKMTASSGAAAGAASALQDQIGFAKLRFNELANSLATATLPALSDLASAFGDVIGEQNTLNNGKGAEWADNLAVGLARVVDVAVLLPRLFSAIAGSFKVVAADIAVLWDASPANMAYKLTQGRNPIEEFKKTLAERNAALAEANKNYEELWNKPANQFEQAVLKRIGQRSPGAAPAAAAPELPVLKYKSAAEAAAKTGEKYTQVLERQGAALADSSRFQEQYQRSVVAVADIYAEAVKDAEKEAEQQELLASTFGMTKSQIEGLELARLEEQLAQRSSLGLTLDEIEMLEKLIAAKKRSGAAMSTMEGLAAQKQAWESIEKTAHDTFVSIFDSGKSAFDRLKDTLKNGLLDLLYQMTVKKWILNISGQVSGQGGLAQVASAFGGSAGADGSALSSLSSLYSMGKTIYSGFTGGLATTMGGWASSAGSMFGSSAMSSFGAGMSAAGGNTGLAAMYASASTSGNVAAGASAGMSAGTYAIPIAGWIAAGMALSNSLYKQGWNAENGSLTDSLGGKAIMPLNAPMLHLNKGLQKLGMSDSMANMFSGASTVSALFGRKDPKIESQGLRGTVSASGFDGDTYANIVEKGGLFRSTKRYTTGTALSSGQDAGLDDTVQAMIQAVHGFGSAMGLETSVITGYTKAIKLELGSDEAKNQEAIGKMFGEIGDELSLRLVPSIASLGKTGETAATTLQRVATNYAAVDSALSSIGKQFGQVGIQSLGAREHLVELFGGVDVLAQSTASYAQNFLTEAERLKPVADALATEMGRLGLASVTTRSQFKQVVDGLNVSTDAGAAQYASLMKLAEAFAAVHPEVEAVTADLSSYRSALTDAYNAESEALKQTVDRMGSFATSLRNLAKSALLGGMSPLSPQQKYAEARSQYEAIAAAARGGDEKAQDRYQDVYTAFLEASRAVNASSTGYQQDFSYAQAMTEEVAKWAGDQVNVGEAQLAILKAQVSSLVDVNKSVLSVREAILQYTQAGGKPLAPQPVPVAIPYYPSEGRTNDATALNAQLEALMNEVAGLRSDQQKQTGDQINAQAEAVADSAVAIARAVARAGGRFTENERVAPE